MSPPPDRYGDAVRARRAELRAERVPLSGTHRAELRTALTLSRLTADDALASGLSRLGASVRARAERPGRGTRRALARELPAGITAAVHEAHTRWSVELAPALRRLAGARRLTMRPGWPDLPGPPAAALPGPPPARPWLTGAVEGLAVGRLALVPLAALPLVGLPALGGPGWAPAAVGAGAAGVTLLVHTRRTSAEHAVLLRWVDVSLAAVRQGHAGDIDRLVLRLEPALAAELDAAIERRKADVEQELRAVAGG